MRLQNFLYYLRIKLEDLALNKLGLKKFKKISLENLDLGFLTLERLNLESFLIVLESKLASYPKRVNYNPLP